MSKLVNAGKPVTGRTFIGRDHELELIQHLVQTGQSVVIIAPRRYGKTSLVLEVLRQLDPAFYKAFIDLFSIPDLEELSLAITNAVLENKKLDKVFTKLKNSALGLIQNARIKAVIEDFEFLLGFSEKNINAWQLVEESLDFINEFATRNDKQIVCALDEFGDIKKFDGSRIVKLFRSKIQRQEHASYIFSGSYESVMNELFVSKQAPFYRFARIINLGPIEKEHFLKFYMTELKKQGIFYEAADASKLLDYTRGHPYYGQLALQQLIIAHKLEGRTPSPAQTFNELLFVERNYLEKVWDDLQRSKENTRVVLSIISSREGLYADARTKNVNVSRSVQKLLGNGFLMRNEENNIILSDPLFEYWIKRNVL
jgi:AAA+ ATPase superfamily predicted ATPase